WTALRSARGRGVFAAGLVLAALLIVQFGSSAAATNWITLQRAAAGQVRIVSAPRTARPRTVVSVSARLTRPMTCQLVARRGRLVALKARRVRARSRYSAGFVVSRAPRAGRWTLEVRCGASKKRLTASDQRSIRVYAPPGGHGLVASSSPKSP